MLRFDPNDLIINNKPGKGNNGNNRNNGGGKKSGKNNKRRNNQEHKNDDSFLKSGMDDFERGAGERSFDDDSLDKDNAELEVQVSEEVAKAEGVLDSFLDEYAAVLSERGNQVPIIIRDMFWDAANALTHYYEPKYQSIVAKMNQVFEIITTQRFASSLTSVLTNEDIEGWNDGVTNVWKDVMFVISTALMVFHTQMKDETISTYIDLLASNGLAGKDIDRLVNELGITKDLAVDLVASIPVVPEDMTDITLRQFYHSFVMKLMDHAEENIDVLDRATQGKLFSFFFGKSKIALKAIGRMLGNLKITGFKNDAQSMIYAEYICMLSERLDAYEIKDIKYVLRFIAEEKKKAGKDALIVFSSVQLAEYDSIRKALLELFTENAEVKDVLLMTS